MHLKPLIIVKESRELSFSEAHKFIKKFHATCAAKAATTLNLNHGKHEPTVSEDVLDKLSLLADETKRQADLHPVTTSTSTGKSSSKRSSIEGSESASKEHKQKKRKLENKGDERVESLITTAPATPSIESSEKKKKKSKKSDKSSAL
jgi:Mg-chelatase subunit ChlI